MLVSFQIKNFLSFENQTFSMEARSVRGKRDHVAEHRGRGDLLRFSCIEGMNATGKSNFVRAIQTARGLIVNGFVPVHEKQERGAAEFAFVIRLGKKKYRYVLGADLHSETFVYECLTDCTGREKRHIFYWSVHSGVYFQDILPDSVWEEVIRSFSKGDVGHLFLKEMGANKIVECSDNSKMLAVREVYLWFEKNLHIISLKDHHLPPCDCQVSTYGNKNILWLLNTLGLCEERNEDLSELSDGAQRIVSMADVFLSDHDHDVYIIDDFGTHLHTLIARKCIDLYLTLAKDKNVQLIVTSHETALLDLDWLRKDEIWFVVKENGNSILIPLDSLNVRTDLRIERVYLKGELVQLW